MIMIKIFITALVGFILGDLAVTCWYHNTDNKWDFAYIIGYILGGIIGLLLGMKGGWGI